jgi:hypothetical protein
MMILKSDKKDGGMRMMTTIRKMKKIGRDQERTNFELWRFFRNSHCLE